jgi:hypothetical protein
MNGYRDQARRHQRRLEEQANRGERIAVPRFTRIDPDDPAIWEKTTDKKTADTDDEEK